MDPDAFDFFRVRRTLLYAAITTCRGTFRSAVKSDRADSPHGGRRSGNPIHIRSFAWERALGGTHESTHDIYAGRRADRSATCACRRGYSAAAHQCRPRAAELADEPPHLRRAALLAARKYQQG